MIKKMYGRLPLLAAVVFLLAACGQPTLTPEPVQTEPQAVIEAPAMTIAPVESEVPAVVEPAPATEAPAAAEGVTLPEVDPASSSGNIVAAGSSTVYPLTEAMAERFKADGFAGEITIDSIGTGGGFERFCKTGETDISNASRAIKDSEVENCTGYRPHSHRVPRRYRCPRSRRQQRERLSDAISPSKSSLLIFSKNVTQWSEVRPEWPAEDILRFSPGTNSGTFDYFVEAVMDPVYAEPEGAGEEAILTAANIQFSEDDNVLVQGVEGSPYAIGYFGFAYFNENQGALNALSIDGIAPNAETAESGDYPLARPLFIYSDAKIMQDKPQVAAFINYYLSFVNDEILEVGYFPASSEALDAAKDALAGCH